MVIHKSTKSAKVFTLEIIGLYGISCDIRYTIHKTKWILILQFAISHMKIKPHDKNLLYSSL